MSATAEIAGQLLLPEPTEAPGYCVCWRRWAYRSAYVGMIIPASRQKASENTRAVPRGPGGPAQWDAWTSMCDLRAAMCLASGVDPSEIRPDGLSAAPGIDWKSCDGQTCPKGRR